MTNERPHPPLLQVHWKKERKWSQFSDWYSFVNGLGRWQAVDKMAFTVWTWEGFSTTINKNEIFKHKRVSPLAYIKIKLIEWHQKNSPPLCLFASFIPFCLYVHHVVSLSLSVCPPGLWERRAVRVWSLLCRQSVAERAEDVRPKRCRRGWMPSLQPQGG